MRPKPDATLTMDMAERLGSALASKQLSLHRASQRSAAFYGRSSPYFLPHNLYYDLRRGTLSPSIYQIAALSRVSGYRLEDWLHLFGFDLELIPRLQVLLHSSRTVLLDSAVDDPDAWIAWLEDKVGNRPPFPSTAALSDFLEFTHYRRLASMTELGNRKFLYAKIGDQDALAFPDLLPGSIVRVDPRLADELVSRGNGTTSKQIFLIEHSQGLCCCRLRVVGDGLIVPVSTQLPYAQTELRLPQEARLLGIVDLEIRPSPKPEPPEVSKELAKLWKPEPLTAGLSLGPWLRRARSQMNLSLREASATSRKIVDLVGDERYFVSPSSLSDYEVMNTPPRHFHKSVALCLIYGLQFRAFLKVIGIEWAELGASAMPDHILGRNTGPALGSQVSSLQSPSRGGFFAELLREFGEVPFFLRSSIPGISGLPEVSLHDFFWTGGERNPLHPYLIDALFVIVNRRKRKPVYFRSKAPWQQPLYAILKRDGTYLCACCGVENGTLVVHPYSQQFYRQTQLRYHQDAEVIGQVVALARKLP